MHYTTFDVEAIAFHTFRIPTATSIIRSFTIPPYTTIRGMISNAMGLAKDDFALQDGDLRIGLQVVTQPVRNFEIIKLLKYVARNEKLAPLRIAFPSSPMTKEFLFKTKYRVFLVGNDELIPTIALSLKNPRRPLYLGQSDDLVDISNMDEGEVTESQSDYIHSMIEGVLRDCEIVRIPYKYRLENGSAGVLSKTFSLPTSYPYQLPQKISCFVIGQEHVTAY